MWGEGKILKNLQISDIGKLEANFLKIYTPLSHGGKSLKAKDGRKSTA